MILEIAGMRLIIAVLIDTAGTARFEPYAQRAFSETGTAGQLTLVSPAPVQNSPLFRRWWHPAINYRFQ